MTPTCSNGQCFIRQECQRPAACRLTLPEGLPSFLSEPLPTPSAIRTVMIRADGKWVAQDIDASVLSDCPKEVLGAVFVKLAGLLGVEDRSTP